MNKIKNVDLGSDARAKLRAGVNKLGDAVKATMGPSGRTVILEKEYGSPAVTKDGVSVAREINLKDPVENMGAQIVKEVALKTAKLAGDGTTTATVLAQFILNEGMKSVDAGCNVIEVKRGMDKATVGIVKALKKISIDVVSNDQIKQVATISSNNDASIGAIIAEAMDSVGKSGVITVDSSKTSETTLEIVEGLQFDRGYISPYFVTDNGAMSCIIESPSILVYDKKVSSIKEILPLLETCSKQTKPLLIIAEDVDGEALATIVVNKSRGILNICAVKAPGYGHARASMLEDVAVLIGATVISPQKGLKLEKLQMDQLGTARSIIVTKDNTTIIGGAGSDQAIKARITELEIQIEKAESDLESLSLKDRVAKLIGGVAVINVGAASEIELKEKKDRVDDALHATKAAVEEGIVSGGGMALIQAAADLEVDCENADQQKGVDIIKKACGAPFNVICENAGRNPEAILALMKVAIGIDNIGYDARKNTNCNMIESGIIDPTKVTRTALEMAVSVAGALLTTEAVVSIEPSEEEEQPQY